MSRRGVRYPIKRIFIIDELAVAAAFFAALLIRYRHNFSTWADIYDGLYVSFLIVICLIQALVFLTYDARKKPVFIQDPIENLASVVKGKLILIILALFYLYATQKGELSSRFVVAALFVISIIFDYLARMIYRKAYLSGHKSYDTSKTLELCEPFPGKSELLDMLRSESYSDVLIHSVSGAFGDIVRICEEEGVRAYIGLELGTQYSVRSGIVCDVNGYASVPAFVRAERFKLFGIDYAVARTEEAALHVIRHIKELSGKYICFSNVHTTVMAKENPEYAAVLNGAAFVFPDGTPIAALQQKKGLVGAERVAGPDFMEHMFKNTQDGQISHYFYGASQDTLDSLWNELLKKYPGINIKGMYSPPYRALSEEEDRTDIERINASGADIVWVGLGAPKQEKWMNAHKGRINGVMMGVGAGFDFHAATIKRAPKWIQKVGFEWLYRLFQDPGRLFKRYFVTNVKFFWYLIVGRGQ